MAIAAASADGKDVFGKNGLFDELKKALAERMRMAPRLKSAQASSPVTEAFALRNHLLSGSDAARRGEAKRRQWPILITHRKQA